MSLLWRRVDVDSYPQLRGREHISDRPGLVLLEYECFRWIRYCTALFVAGAPVWWWWHRRKMAVNDQVLYRLHHVVLHSSANAVNVGLAGGMMTALYRASQMEGEKRIVNEAVALRCSKPIDQWNQTAGKVGAMGVMITIPLSSEGGLWLRAARGLGLGVLMGALTSYTKFDVSMNLLMG